ncbi:MAG: DoxX family protein [Sphingobacteriales bacterium 50-39]|nr:DoxX family protein [Sphingobacteriales bacterium]OJW60214.1 MAG: DoxX family protein [Sphingobacteriales bacterium 50-39]
MKILVSIARIIVGVLFIFSGLVKANDPLGLSYKMQEFFEVWNFHWLDSYTLIFSIVMIVFEIVAGVAILLGWRMRLFSWLLLLLIIFFTFLTGYAYLSGKVRECGCFGDCIPLSAGQSFSKDLILLVLILFLFFAQKRIKPLLSQVASIAILVLATVLSVAFQWYVLIHLPTVDCLPYRAGTNMPEKMKAPPGSIPDSTVITMVYNKNGKQIDIVGNNFPADFDDSYKFVSRYDKLVRKGNAEPAIKDFVLLTETGTDTTQAVLEQDGFKIFIFTKELDEYPAPWVKEFSLIYTMAKAKHIPLYFITGNYDNVADWTRRAGVSDGVSILKCDATAIKTAARANPTLYLLKKGTILQKWSYADLGLALPSINELPGATTAIINHDTIPH